MAAQGGIISAAMELIKEKERQGDKAMDRLHDGFKTQMQLTANQGSWTGDANPSQVIKEKETVTKVKEPEEEKEDKSSNSTPTTPAPAPADDKKDEKDIADMGIIGLAQGAK
ncbi:hypothetical protein EEL40_00320 [Muribaculaceae bacterium Isolate-083 (Janvier)]|uniref:hypothetical protein n=1 Tax=Duncaniella muris TaxID=2094150 RepID=UPI000F487210|nr:hypothetical protein [Duncaniella muris]ROT00709.1 hypothetical protein EEL40_00320 [Muribaculaceae bacterium Isolate-083 (Janvier)]